MDEEKVEEQPPAEEQPVKRKRGRPPGSSPLGRPPGTRPNKLVPKSIWKEQIFVPDDCTPLEYMLRLMRDYKIDPVRRDRMAIAAAPYLHPRYDEKMSKKEIKEMIAATPGGGDGWGDALDLPDTIKMPNIKKKAA